MSATVDNGPDAERAREVAVGRLAEGIGRLVTSIGSVVVGKPDAVRLAAICLLTEGHLLIEDVPGTGKTSLARAMAEAIDGSWSRIQFTPDLLPADVTGVTIYDQRSHEFDFRPGPVFSNIVVADEINRASPRTQSALLEVMEEAQVTVDGAARPVPRPFVVVATQNPFDHAGTYPLPESQLDRFTMRLSLGYADHATELAIVERAGSQRVARAAPVMGLRETRELIAAGASVYVADTLAEYLVAIVEATRSRRDLRLGVSSRGTVALTRTSQLMAAAEGRAYVVPEDVKAVAEPVLAHRLAVTPDAAMAGVTAADVLEEVLDTVAVPPNGR